MNQISSIKTEIAKLGAQFNPSILAATRALYEGQIAPPSGAVHADYDIAYGPDPRQTLDVYSERGGTPKPVLLYVPGGGFTGGDKRIDDTFYGNLARWFAAEGFVVVTMNYRLAPDHVWPSGAQDVGSALAWITANISRHGGDPGNILLFGQSAGATHVATFLYHPKIFTPIAGIRGAVLASGPYRMTEQHRAPNLLAYFGTDATPICRPLAGHPCREQQAACAADCRGVRSRHVGRAYLCAGRSHHATRWQSRRKWSG